MGSAVKAFNANYLETPEESKGKETI